MICDGGRQAIEAVEAESGKTESENVAPVTMQHMLKIAKQSFNVTTSKQKVEALNLQQMVVLCCAMKDKHMSVKVLLVGVGVL